MHGLMLSARAIGLFFAAPVFTVIFSRVLFEPRLPDALKPSLLILVAPLGVGYSAHTGGFKPRSACSLRNLDPPFIFQK
jgi:tellurite resistance protein